MKKFWLYCRAVYRNKITLAGYLVILGDIIYGIFIAPRISADFGVKFSIGLCIFDAGVPCLAATVCGFSTLSAYGSTSDYLEREGGISEALSRKYLGTAWYCRRVGYRMAMEDFQKKKR
jgi:hypothetical protein